MIEELKLSTPLWEFLSPTIFPRTASAIAAIFLLPYGSFKVFLNTDSESSIYRNASAFLLPYGSFIQLGGVVGKQAISVLIFLLPYGSFFLGFVFFRSELRLLESLSTPLWEFQRS